MMLLRRHDSGLVAILLWLHSGAGSAFSPSVGQHTGRFTGAAAGMMGLVGHGSWYRPGICKWGLLGSTASQPRAPFGVMARPAHRHYFATALAAANSKGGGQLAGSNQGGSRQRRRGSNSSNSSGGRCSSGGRQTPRLSSEGRRSNWLPIPWRQQIQDAVQQLGYSQSHWQPKPWQQQLLVQQVIELGMARRWREVLARLDTVEGELGGTWRLCAAVTDAAPAVVACGRLAEVDRQLHSMQRASEHRASWVFYLNAMNICACAGDWRRALALLDGMEAIGVDTKTTTTGEDISFIFFNMAIRACMEAGRTAEADAILAQMIADGDKPTLLNRSTLVGLHDKCGSVARALDILQQARDAAAEGSRHDPNVQTYTSTMEVWEPAAWQQERDSKWLGDIVTDAALAMLAECGSPAEAMQLLDSFERALGRPAGWFFYSKVMHVCACAGHWRRAPALLDRFERALDRPADWPAYSDVLKVYARAGAWRRALALLNRLEASVAHTNVFNEADYLFFNGAIDACMKAGRTAEADVILERALARWRRSDGDGVHSSVALSGAE
eukprot:TRINITY_DN6300_c0_g1_i4.p1 TRINITY_DN6300_c0_g1~~TRINITY_DN6300_c0_g1_i4.p1  ORF type:complete len:556 (-),score=131.18 TRINITY_DN6300_c0_g1_i4:170-1837(-)